jgi:hypothetical protein
MGSVREVLESFMTEVQAHHEKNVREIDALINLTPPPPKQTIYRKDFYVLVIRTYLRIISFLEAAYRSRLQGGGNAIDTFESDFLYENGVRFRQRDVLGWLDELYVSELTPVQRQAKRGTPHPACVVLLRLIRSLSVQESTTGRNPYMHGPGNTYAVQTSITMLLDEWCLRYLADMRLRDSEAVLENVRAATDETSLLKASLFLCYFGIGECMKHEMNASLLSKDTAMTIYIPELTIRENILIHNDVWELFQRTMPHDLLQRLGQLGDAAIEQEDALKAEFSVAAAMGLHDRLGAESLLLPMKSELLRHIRDIEDDPEFHLTHWMRHRW